MRRDSPVLALFAGPAGAGKTTLAAAWCETRDRAVHIELDEMRSLIVAGYADPESGGLLVGEQYATSVRACCALARVFLEAGYDVAIDDVMEPEPFAKYWRPALGGRSHSLVVVLPGLEDTLARSASRTKRVRHDITRQQHQESQAWPAELKLDTSGLDVAASLSFARERGLLP